MLDFPERGAPFRINDLPQLHFLFHHLSCLDYGIEPMLSTSYEVSPVLKKRSIFDH